MGDVLSDRTVTVDVLDKPGVETSRGYIPTHNGLISDVHPELAAEIAEKNPLAIVTEHGRIAGEQGIRGGGKMGGSMITVPACGYFANKKYWFELRDERKAQEVGGTLENSVSRSNV